MAVVPGIEILLREKLDWVRQSRVGAIVHPASVLPSLQHSADALFEALGNDLACLFGPQHGARGEKQDNMIESAHFRDPEIGVPVFSLYSETRCPTPEMLGEVDVLLFDLQDVGTRVYTFVHTLSLCLEACASAGKRVIVLDRPNPIDGVHVEGNILDPAYGSFVGLHPVPMRHGLTVGEMALLVNSEFGIGCELTVVAMQGWKRSMWFDQTGLPWIAPSPNIPTLDTATVYPGMVLLEGTSLSEGRGTTRPFELVGAPYIHPRRLADTLNDLRLPGVFFRPAYFEPTFQKHAGEGCGGVQLHIKDREMFEPYLAGLLLISTIARLYPSAFRWREPPYEYEFEKLPIEILCGSGAMPGMLEKGTSAEELRESWKLDVVEFRKKREKYLLYD